MEKAKANYLLRRCYRLLADPSTLLRHRKFRGQLHGISYATVQVMAVDFRKDALATIIHECLHIIYPNWSESAILDSEKGIVDSMTQQQFNNLMSRIAVMKCGGKNGTREAMA
jgi:hypothetical protein